MTEADLVTELVVKPWIRCGHDRLYVQTTDGTRLGYWDDKTGQTVVEDEVHREAVAAATRAFRGAPALPVPLPTRTRQVDGVSLPPLKEGPAPPAIKRARVSGPPASEATAAE